jgi:hypothetical protein
MLYIAIFFVLLLILFLLYGLKIKAVIKYIRNEQDEWVKIVFCTKQGTIRYEYKVPLVNAEKVRIKFKLVKGQSDEMRGGSEKHEKLMPMDILEKYNSVRAYLKDHAKLFENIRKYLNKKRIHVELKISLKQGTGDAAQTGLICGLLWSAAGILVSTIARHLRVLSKEIKIRPCFDKSIFEVEASFIFHVRLVHIIVVLRKIYFMKFLIKMKARKMIGGEVSG